MRLPRANISRHTVSSVAFRRASSSFDRCFNEADRRGCDCNRAVVLAAEMFLNPHAEPGTGDSAREMQTDRREDRAVCSEHE